MLAYLRSRWADYQKPKLDPNREQLKTSKGETWLRGRNSRLRKRDSRPLYYILVDTDRTFSIGESTLKRRPQ